MVYISLLFTKNLITIVNATFFNFLAVTDLESSTNEVSSTVARKRIISPSSDSDSEIETQVHQHSEIVITKNSAFINRFNGTKMKNPSILEKEKQMKFLLEIFPNLEAMVSMKCFI